MATYLKFIAGDFGKDEYRYHRGDKLHCQTSPFMGKRLRISDIVSCEEASQESVKKMGGTVGAAVVGGLLLGGVGAVVGGMAGGNTTETTVIITTRDGLTGLARANSPMLDVIRGTMFDGALKAERSSGEERKPLVVKGSRGFWMTMLVLSIVLILVGAGMFTEKNQFGGAIPFIFGVIMCWVSSSALRALPSSRKVSSGLRKVARWLAIGMGVLFLGCILIAGMQRILETPQEKAEREATTHQREAEQREKAAAEATAKAEEAAKYAEEGKALAAYLKKKIGTKGVGGDYTVEFKTIDKSGCNFSVLYEKGSLSEDQAQVVTCGFVIVAAQFYAENGRKPSAEGMKIVARVFTPEKRATETRWVSPYGYAYYDSSDDQAVWKRGDGESMLKKLLK